MKQLFRSLPFKLAVGVGIGILFGLLPFAEAYMEVVVTLKYVMNQIILFCVPLIIIGFIAPSITKLGSHASKLLGVAVGSAYISSVGAAFFCNARRLCTDPPAFYRFGDGGVKGAAGACVPAGYSADHAGDERACVLDFGGAGGGMDKGGDGDKAFGGISGACALCRDEACDSDSSGVYRSDLLRAGVWGRSPSSFRYS